MARRARARRPGDGWTEQVDTMVVNDDSTTDGPVAVAVPAPAAEPLRRAAGWMTRVACCCAWLAMVLAMLLTSPQAWAQDQEPLDPGLEEASSQDWQLASDTIKALRDGDVHTLGQLTDFPARMDEGVARGRERRAWADLDDLDRVLASSEIVEGWLSAQSRHLESGTLYNIRVLDDPDAGWGPVPDRRVTQAVVKAARSGQLLDLVLVATPDGLLLDLKFGEPYVAGHNPLADAGLQTDARPELTDQRVRWPSGLDDFDREEVEELVEFLLEAERPSERREVVETMHRNPRAAVAGLLERVLEMNEDRSPDRAEQRLLMDALETITGRSSSFVAVARFDQDEGSLDATNAADLAAWLRWHQRHGGTFVAATVEDPRSPTFGERPVTASADEDEDEDEGGGRTARAATREPETAPVTGPATPGRAPPKKPISAPRPVTPAPAPVAEPGDNGSGPRVTIRKPAPKPRAERALLKDEAAALEILWGAREVTAGEVADQIPAPVRRVLDAWADDIVALNLTVCLSGNPDHVVMGRAPNDVLIAAAKNMDAAWEILDPVLPKLVKRTERPTLAILFDGQAPRDTEFWSGLIAALESKRALLPDEASRLTRSPDGVMARNYPMFLQPTFDQAGNAAAGDDEFRLANEVVHKFAQCFLTQRCGQMPESIRWAIGHLIEYRLLESIYQFNTTGFVASGDHFDWPRRGRRLLEKAAKKRKFSLAELLLGIDYPRGDTDVAVMTWGVMDSALSLDPAQFSGLLEALSEVHADKDPYGVGDDYKGDDKAAVAAVELRLAKLEMDDVIDRLDKLD